MKNATLFNCCKGNTEPAWHAFESLHIGPCRSGDGQTIELEPGDPDIEFWTIYGRTTEGDGLAITDVSTERLAWLALDRMIEIASERGVSLKGRCGPSKRYWISRAKDQWLPSDDVNIDADAKVSAAEDGQGAWVQAWLWVPA